MNVFSSLFAVGFSIVLFLSVVHADPGLIVDALPYENGSSDHLDGYQATPDFRPAAGALPYENGSLNHLDGSQTVPDFRPVAGALPYENGSLNHLDYKFPPVFIVLPGGDPSGETTDHPDYKPSEQPKPANGPANFLATVADARGRSFGTLKLDVSAGRTFTGVLRLAKKAYRFHGKLDASGAASQVFAPRTAQRVAIALQVSGGRMAATVTKGTVILSAQ